MNMDKIPTPETDAAYKQWLFESDKSHRIRMGQTMESLERRLFIAREALRQIQTTGYDGPLSDYSRNQIEESLKQTAPKPCK